MTIVASQGTHVTMLSTHVIAWHGPIDHYMMEFAMTGESTEYMTRTEVKDYVQAWSSEMVFGVVAGLGIGLGLVNFLGLVSSEGLEAAFALDGLLEWALFFAAGVLSFFALLSARKKRKALES